jgi:hypothetical protein
MKTKYTAWAAVGASLLVAACGGGGSDSATGTQNSNPGRGELMQSPPLRVTSLSAADYNARLNGSATGQGLLTLSTGSPTGAVPCGIDVQYVKYGTVGANGEATTASAALIVPTGTNPACIGGRPIVLHAHGTAVERRYNMADFTDSTNPGYAEAQVLAAIYAANGYIVVAPNYAGYDSSSLSYHPFLVASQQSKDMLDALVAAKTALPTLISGISTNGKVFLSGFSQGGHVALATHKAMITDPAMVSKLASLGLTVKASAPMSGPYAMKDFGDKIMGGAVIAGSTQFFPLLINSYQKAYGNIYTSVNDIYENTYATGIDSLFPGSYSYTTSVTSGKVPQTALFDTASLPAASSNSSPLLQAIFSTGFGTPNLVKSSFRTGYLTDVTNNLASPTHPLRVAAKLNDLTSMATPVGATMLCGANQDPTVTYATNTGAMVTQWASFIATPSAPTNPVTLVDLDLGVGTANPADPFGPLKTSFTAASTKVRTDAFAAAIAAGKTPTEANIAAVSAYAGSYHGAPLPYCVKAASAFFALVP